MAPPRRTETRDNSAPREEVEGSRPAKRVVSAWKWRLS